MPLISYNLNIPNAPNNPSADQPKMQINTNSINNIIARDHYEFNNNNSSGTHKQVTLTNEAAPGFADGTAALFANNPSGQSYPFWQNAIGTFPILTQGTSVLANNGYFVFQNGIIVQWGQITSTNSALTPLLFTTANINFPNNCFIVETQPYYSGSPPNGTATVAIRKSTVSNTGFSWAFVTSSGAYTGFYWFAIGN